MYTHNSENFSKWTKVNKVVEGLTQNPAFSQQKIAGVSRMVEMPNLLCLEDFLHDELHMGAFY